MKIKLAAAGGIAALLFLSGCSSDEDEATAPETTAAPSAMASEPAMSEEPGTIVDVAAANPDFETLVAAVTAAGWPRRCRGRVRSRSSRRPTRRSMPFPRVSSMRCCSRRTRTP